MFFLQVFREAGPPKRWTSKPPTQTSVKYLSHGYMTTERYNSLSEVCAVMLSTKYNITNKRDDQIHSPWKPALT